MSESLKRKGRAPLNGLSFPKGMPEDSAPSVSAGLEAREPKSLIRGRRRRTNVQELLPEPPRLPGFHTTWMGGEDKNEMSIKHNAIRNGYSPVTWQEAAEHDAMWSLSFMPPDKSETSLIQVNEKTAYKVPLQDYTEIMEELHHWQPQDQETSTKDQALSFSAHAETKMKAEEGGIDFGKWQNKKSQPDFSEIVHTKND